MIKRKLIKAVAVKVFFILQLLLLAAVAEQRQFVISADDWARPRSGDAIIGFQILRDLVVIWSTAGDDSMIEVRYPGGDEGGLWAQELSDWLVALGVPSNRIQLMPGNARADQISLLITQSRY